MSPKIDGLSIRAKRDPVVPPLNAQYLGDHLPNSKVAIIDASHFIWEDAADEYAALVADWWDSH